MPYQASWHVVHKVMEARFWGKVSLEDTDHHTEACVRMLTEAQNHNPTEMVYLLLDALEAENFPPLYQLFARNGRVLKFKNRGPMFAITRDSAIKSIFEVTAYMTREHVPFRLFSERQDAIDALEGYLASDAQRAAQDRDQT